ncbi:MAG: filamentous hemagglutinin N-terminal domain-containing protein [Candidatus Omnitrophica bacterium]|nr:filamentous hemagglutinin N-terminal domain-containing protein [Candidatus Omnitrophota bacterium]
MTYWMKLICVVISALLIGLPPAWALPTLAEIIHGEAEVEQIDEKTLRINASDKTIINYRNFSLGKEESLIINLPSVKAEILNRVVGKEFSNILGSVSCNGVFILVNQSGVYVGPNAKIDAASAVISTRDITNSDFLSGNYLFKKLSDEQLDILLKNDGTINVSEGGFGVLIAGGIENNGVITAPVGKIVLASGDAIKLDIAGEGLISVAIDEAVASTINDFDGRPLTDQIKNTGELSSDGGVVVLKAQSITDIFSNAINLDGIVQARSLQHRDGRIELVADKTVSISGVMDVSGIREGADGGKVAVAADTILSEGIIKANAHDHAKAGDIDLVGQTLSVYEDGTLIEAKGKNTLSEGGDVYINTLEGDTDYREGALVDVSGGTVSGNAGFLEISAKYGLGYHGSIRGEAQQGYKGGSVFFDPYDIIIQAGGYDTVFGGDEGGSADETYSEHSGLSLTFDPSANGSFWGFSNIHLQATHDIVVNSDFDTSGATGSASVDLKLEADNDITVNADITTNNADIDLYADGNITQTAGSDITAGSGDVFIYADADENGTGTLTRDAASTVSNDGSFWMKSGSALSTSTLLTAGDTATGELSVHTTGDHSITIDSDVSRADETISFFAAGDLTHAAGSDIDAGDGFVYLYADDDENGTGSLIRDAASTVSNTRPFRIKSGSDLATSTLLTAGDAVTGELVVYTTNDHAIAIDSDISRANQNIRFYAAGDLIHAAGSDINAGNGMITLVADFDENGTGALTRDAASTLTNSSSFFAQSASNLVTSDLFTAGDTTTGVLAVATTGDHDITIDSDISRVNRSISFYAAGNLTQGPGSDVTAGSGNVYLHADADENGVGALTRDATSTVTNSSHFSLKSASNLATSTVLTAGDTTTGWLYVYTTDDADTTIDSDINRVNQSIYFYSDGNLTQNTGTTITVGSGNVYLYADYDEDGTGSLSRPGTALISNSGYLALQSASDITVSSLLRPNEMNDVSTTGQLSLFTTDNHGITIDADISRTNKNIKFYSAGDLTQNTATTLSAGSGQVFLYADYDEDGTGSLSRPGTAIVNNSGTFELRSGSDIVVSSLLRPNELNNISTTGYLILCTNGNHFITIDADVTRTDRGIEFYSAGDLTQNTATTLSAGSGGIYLYADRDDDGTGSLSRPGTALISNSGYLALQSASDITVSSLLRPNELNDISATGHLALYTNDNHNITLDANLARTNKAVYFLADGDLVQNTGIDIDAGTGTVFFYADTDGDGTGAVNQTGTATLTGGNIYFTTAESGSILNATSNGAGNDITVTATGGSVTLGDLTSADDIILENSGGSFFDDGNDATHLSGDTVQIYAAGELGSPSSYLGTDATTLEFSAVNGSVYIEEVDTAALNPSSAHNGSVNLSFDVVPAFPNLLGASGQGVNTISITQRSGNYTINGFENLIPEENYGFFSSGGNIIFNPGDTGGKGIHLGGNIITLPANLTARNFIISSGTVTAPNLLIVSGDFDVQNATFNHNNGTVRFVDASRTSRVYGTTFWNLECTTPGKEIKFQAGATETVLNNLTLRGTAGNLLSLTSTSAGSQWNIDAGGAYDISYVYVKDSYNRTGVVFNPVGSTDGGNTVMWFAQLAQLPPEHLYLWGMTPYSPREPAVYYIPPVVNFGEFPTAPNGPLIKLAPLSPVINLNKAR